MIASLTLFLLWLDEGERTIGRWKYALPSAHAFSFIHDVQQVSLPELQGNQLADDAIHSALSFLFVLLAVTVKFYQWMTAIIFLLYLLYGVLRPFLSPKRRRVIEEEIGEEHPIDEPVEDAVVESWPNDSSLARISGSRTSAQSPVNSSALHFLPERARSRMASVSSNSPRGERCSPAMYSKILGRNA